MLEGRVLLQRLVLTKPVKWLWVWQPLTMRLPRQELPPKTFILPESWVPPLLDSYSSLLPADLLKSKFKTLNKAPDASSRSRSYVPLWLKVKSLSLSCWKPQKLWGNLFFKESTSSIFEAKQGPDDHDSTLCLNLTFSNAGLPRTPFYLRM